VGTVVGAVAAGRDAWPATTSGDIREIAAPHRASRRRRQGSACGSEALIVRVFIRENAPEGEAIGIPPIWNAEFHPRNKLHEVYIVLLVAAKAADGKRTPGTL
jgi:hypothetical protein